MDQQAKAIFCFFQKLDELYNRLFRGHGAMTTLMQSNRINDLNFATVEVKWRIEMGFSGNALGTIIRGAHFPGQGITQAGFAGSR